MAGLLRLKLLGSFELRSAASGPTIPLSARKPALLLAYLALRPPGQAQTRDKLAGLFWGDSGEVRARASLRQALTALRRQLGPHGEGLILAPEGEMVALAPDSLATDVADLERCLASENRDALERAVGLYEGDFLEGFHAPREPLLEEWLVAERQRLRERALAVMAALLPKVEAAGPPEAAVRLALRVLALDPLQEAAHRTLMRLHARQGRRGAALARYQTLRERLARELGTTPEAETQHLYKEIRDRRGAPDDGVAPPPPEPVGPPPDGSAAAEPAAEATTATDPKARSPSPERRRLTVLACDLYGSGEFAARLDPEETHDLAGRYHKAVASEVSRLGGHVARLAGGDAVAWFGWPQAQEDAAERAIRAGLAVVAAVAQLRDLSGRPLAARVGVATGLVVAGDPAAEGAAAEQVVVGVAPSLASRLRDLAPPGAVLLAEGTRDLVAGLFELEELLPRRIGGLVAAVPAWRAVAERPAETRFEARRGPGAATPMFGREQELALLLGRWRLARSGEGQAAVLVGEPGIGKSRLVQAVLDAVGEEEHMALRYQCSPLHVGTALWPVARQLARATGPGSGDDAARLEKLEALLRQGADNIGEAAPLVAALLGIDAGDRYPPQDLTSRQRRVRTLAALVAQLLGLARRHGPVLMVLEDAHWADPSTIELVGQTLDRMAAARVLLVLTSRPDGQPALGGHPLVTRLTLGRLGREATEAIATRLAGGRGGLSAGVLDEIRARADGVPLFVEELTKAVLEAGAASPGSAVPASLHDTLMARLERAPGAKEVAQVAACLGREFAYPLLAAVSPVPEPELRAALDRLAAAELVFARGEPPEAGYSFKHALVRDAAYESLLRAERRRLHARIAVALEERFPETVAAEPELLARHAEAAGETGRAVDLWAEAGRAATRRYANAEALRHLEAGSRLLRSLPEDRGRDRHELDLRLAAGPSLIAVKGYASPEVEATYERALSLAERLSDGGALFAALRGLWNCVYDRGDLERGLGLAERLVFVAEQRDDPKERALAWRALGSVRLGRGELGRALEAFGCGLDACAALPADACLRSHGEAPAIICAQYAGWAQTLTGHPDTGLALARRGADEARGLGHPLGLAFALANLGIVHALRREPRACEAAAAEMLALSGEHGFAFWSACGGILLGWARAQAGDPAGGAELLGRGLLDWRATGAGLHVPLWSAFLADALIDAARHAEAGAVLAEALRLAVEHHELYAAAELHRLRGRLALAENRPDDAEAAFALALIVARKGDGRLMELRAGTSLAKLRAGRERRQEARDLLAPIRDRLTEGSGLPDLRDATALLDQLR